MISDDTNNNDDLDNEFEVNDEFDDGFDEDWDDDELPEDDISGAEVSAINDMEESPVSIPAKKTFMQKFFIPVVVAVIALFGGLFILGQGLLSGSSETPAPVEAQAQNNAQLPASEDMGAVAQGLVEDNELPELPDETASSLDQPLTPLPGTDFNNNDQSIELVDLEAELQDSSDDTALEDTMQLLDNTEKPAEQVEEIIPELTAEPDIAEDTLDADLIDSAHEEPEMENIPDIETIEAIEPVEAVADIAPETMAVTSEEEALQLTDDSLENAESITEEEPDNQGNEALIAENNTLKQEVEANLQTIEALRAEIAMLKEEAQNIAQQAPEKDEKPATESAEEIVPEAPKVVAEEADVVEKPKARPSHKAIQWVLKSAQPGKATIAQTGSDDLRTIEIGQKVSGLGRINSIQIENGLWVVRGSHGSVSQ